MTDVRSGLVVYRASRLEALLTPLTALLQAAPPDAVLAPHQIIAAHPGVRSWLGRELARHAGPAGIAANLRIELPSAWFDRLAGEVLGAEAIAQRPYRPEFLRWRIHARLDAASDPALAAWLDGEAATRAQRRLQLADHLARLYSQCLVYRPDWLKQWAAGRAVPAAAAALATLWRQLHRDIGSAHRGERIEQLIGALGRDAGHGREPLHVFGLVHLAPSELALLKAVAQQRLVALYLPDPCREYWGGLRSERASLRELVARDPHGAATEGAFLDQGHPLLAAWGRMGQHFVLALDEAGVALDTRHWEDSTDTPPQSRLQGVQESIRRFQPALIGEHAASPRSDASLRVHACHTRLRELEVLRDALLQARLDRPELRPAQIAVLMPDVHAYLPLLPAVFGAAGRAEGPLPYHCADVAVRHAHPLFEAFRRLLDLPQARLTAPELADLIALAPIAAQLGIGERDRDTIEHWLEASRAAWALDAEFRARFQVPAISEHTHGWALDRLLAGYVLGAGVDAGGGEDQDVVGLPDGTRLAPLAGAHGPQAELLGQLDRLLVELGEACRDGARPRRASEWSQRLEQRIERLFRVEPDDSGGRDALARLLDFVRAIAAEPADAGLDPELDFAVVRELLLAQIDGVPARQAFLPGGITFCGMVPQRAIPFEFIAVLGLNDGEFPRAGPAGSLDLLQQHPRLGDRDVRSDDRYLFLETVMAARWRLHLSYIGEGVRDGKPRNPAAPLAELMAALDAAATAGADAPAQPWRVRHPLQPFDARYYDGSDPALYSFRSAWATWPSPPAAPAQAGAAPPVAPSAAGAPAAPAAPTAPTAPTASDRVDAAPAPIALGTLLDYYRDPARTLCEAVFGLRLDALRGDRLRESEPLEPATEALDRVAARVFLEQAGRGERAAPAQAPEWLRLAGVLPPGRPGEQAWAVEADKVDAMFAIVAAPTCPAHALFAQALPPAQAVAVEQVLGAYVLRGELQDVREDAIARWRLCVRPGKKEDELGFADRIGAFIGWALLRLATPPPRAVRLALLAAPGKDAASAWSVQWNAWDEHYLAAAGVAQAQLRADLERRLLALVEFFVAAEAEPLAYLPKTSWTALEGDAAAIVKTWAGTDHATGESQYAPGYARLLAGTHDLGEAALQARLRANAHTLRALIQPASAAQAAAP